MWLTRTFDSCRPVSVRARFETVHPLCGRDFAEVLRIVWPQPFAAETINRFRHTLETREAYRSHRTIERRPLRAKGRAVACALDIAPDVDLPRLRDHRSAHPEGRIRRVRIVANGASRLNQHFNEFVAQRQTSVLESETHLVSKETN